MRGFAFKTRLLHHGPHPILYMLLSVSNNMNRETILTIIGTALAGIAAWTGAQFSGVPAKVTEHEVKITAIEKKLDSMDSKLDRLIMRQGR